MRVSLSKSQIIGAVIAPPSKSYTIRALMCAALARGESETVNPLASNDTEAAINVLSKIGAGIQKQKNSWRINGGSLHEPDGDLFCGDSAATLRFMTAICSFIPGKCRLTAGASLSRRPVEPLLQALRQLGIDCSSTGGNPPVTINGGSLRGGGASLPGDISSQFVSALLLIAPLAEQGMSINLTTTLKSEPYVEMTLACLKKFGIKVTASPRRFDVARQEYQPARCEVEGDWSSASYFLALGALSGETTVLNLNPDSLQGDRTLVKLLQEMGAEVKVEKNKIIARKSRLKAINADLSNCIDLLPTVSVLAAAADGVSEFTGIRMARLKESDRVAAVREGLGRMGINTSETGDVLTIIGSTPRGAAIDSKNDHRIAMAFSALGTVAGETTIDPAECVSKTFPEFWDILKRIGGKLEIDGE